MATALDLITSSMRLIGVLAAGETPSSDESTAALGVFNDLLAEWNIQKFLVPSKVSVIYNMVGGTQTYTLGPGGVFNTTGAVSTLVQAAGGTGYAVNDVLTLVQAGGSGCTIKVLTVAAGVITSFSILTPGTGYSIANGLATTVAPPGGTGATFNLTAVVYDRPIKIESGSILLNSLRQPLELITSKQWADIREKALSGILPRVLYNDNAYPLANVNFHPIPSGTPQVELYLWQQLQAVATIATTLVLPPGYSKALRYNLAVDLSAEFGKKPDEVVVAIAQQSKQALAVLNASNNEALDEPAQSQVARKVAVEQGATA